MSGTKRNLVPIDEIGPVIRELVAERWPHTYGYDVLAEKIGCDESAIYSVARVENDMADFDLVDKILCALGRWDMWHGRFAHIYPTKFLEKCASPACNKMFPERKNGDRVKRYCSKRCLKLGQSIRRGKGTGLRARGYCNKGHKLTPENSIPSGGYRRCRICTHEKHAERMKDPAYREYRRLKSQRTRERARAARGA